MWILFQTFCITVVGTKMLWISGSTPLFKLWNMKKLCGIPMLWKFSASMLSLIRLIFLFSRGLSFFYACLFHSPFEYYHWVHIFSLQLCEFVRYDIIVDATDNAPTRYMISDCCVVLGKVNLNVSVNRKLWAFELISYMAFLLLLKFFFSPS